MTASFSPSQPATGNGPAPTTALIVGIVAGVTVIALFLAGVTFIGLAIAFPIAVPVAIAYHLPVSAADAALAEQFAGFWWAFVALAFASFAGMVVIAVKLVGFLSPAPRD